MRPATALSIYSKVETMIGAPLATQNKREHLTEDLLKRLLASSSIDAYLDEGETVDQTLPSYLRCLIDERRIKRSDVARNSGLNPTVVYDIFAGKSRPGRDHAIMLALGIGCTRRGREQGGAQHDAAAGHGRRNPDPETDVPADHWQGAYRHKERDECPPEISVGWKRDVEGLFAFLFGHVGF